MRMRSDDDQKRTRNPLFELGAIDSTSGREGVLHPALEGILTGLGAPLRFQTPDPIGSGEVPPRAAVVPDSRPARGSFAAGHGLSHYTPIIVKTRDASTETSTATFTALEEALR